MKVYVLLQCTHAGDDYLGVFSSEEAARVAIQQEDLFEKNDGLELVETSLDCLDKDACGEDRRNPRKNLKP